MHAVTAELLAGRDGATTIFKKTSGVLHRYDLGGTHARTGSSVPDLELSDGTRVAEHFATGKAVLFDLADSPELRDRAAAWGEHLRIVTTEPTRPQDLSALLMRPDGCIAWAADHGNLDGLDAALTRWFGTPHRS